MEQYSEYIGVTYQFDSDQVYENNLALKLKKTNIKNIQVSNRTNRTRKYIQYSQYIYSNFGRIHFSRRI